jgi:hypothetical protein
MGPKDPDPQQTLAISSGSRLVLFYIFTKQWREPTLICRVWTWELKYNTPSLSQRNTVAPPYWIVIHWFCLWLRPLVELWFIGYRYAFGCVPRSRRDSLIISFCLGFALK